MENMKLISLICILMVYNVFAETPEEKEGVKYADNCEACKVLATELDLRLTETGKSHDVLEIGYNVDDVKPKKKKEYRKSQLRLIESMENLCDRVLEYNIHKERKDSTRFAKGMSQTFQTLHGLVDKGVKVELGIPLELWDKPSAEITQLKTQCENLLEFYEEEIENWYFEHQGDIPLIKFLCEDKVLKDRDSSCLYEVFKPEDKEKDTDTKKKGEKKKKSKKSTSDEKEKTGEIKGDKVEL